MTGTVSSDGAPPTTAHEQNKAVLRWTEPELLRALERQGLSYRQLFAKLDGTPGQPESVATSRSFRALRAVIESDLDAAKRKDPSAGVGVARFSHRLFDVKWLQESGTHFDLVGIVNRFDRLAFDANSCGEVRLIYRLAYTREVRGETLSSRLPMTLGFEFTLPRQATDAHCARAARRFVTPANASNAELAAWLTSEQGPLHESRLAFRPETLRVVINVQQVRWPSTVRPDLAGHAEYLLRAFRPHKERGLVEEGLENSIDAARIAKNPDLKRELVAYLSSPEVLPKLDDGTLLLPEKFLAKRAISVTPRGLARLANRPFRDALSAKDFSGIDYRALKQVRSPEALLRRLDQLSCQGCHQVRSVAGFHLLGEDPKTAPSANSLAFGVSAHSLEDNARRAELLAAALAGTAISTVQPFAERPNLARGNYGAHCGLGSDPSFAEWTCARGLRCSAYDEAAQEGIGICLPEDAGHAGDPCEVGQVSAHRDPHRDRVNKIERRRCVEGAVCNTNSVGFPGGMCTEGCVERGQTTCGAIAILDPFNACLARGEAFTTCLGKNVRAAGLRACDSNSPCRDDYICARTAKGGGACIPPYFLFQLRVDGH